MVSSVTGVESRNRFPGNARESIVSEKERSQCMLAGSPGAIPVELVLLTFFGTREKAVADGGFKRSPLADSGVFRAPRALQVDVATIGGSRKERAGWVPPR